MSEIQPANPPGRTLPTPREFLPEVPLYKNFELDEKDVPRLEYLLNFLGHLDCYCLECGRDSVFHPNSISRRVGVDLLNDKDVWIRYECSRDNDHKMVFILMVKNRKLSKVGQFPSSADLSNVELKRYRKILEDDQYFELSRAVGLISHGVGIGAFVYLRRIFEALVEEAHRSSIEDDGWDELAYKASRMPEKIQLLTSRLPDFLVENRQLYGILSTGVHELSEQECLDAFPTVRLGIELILDERIREKERQEKIETASKSIGKLGGLLGSKKD